MTLKRIQAEFVELQREPVSNWSAAPADIFNMYYWQGTFVGPADSLYAGGCFNVNINYPQDYPYKPLKVTFTTKIYHPQVDNNGAINLDILKKQWSPALTIGKVLFTISFLLEHPEAYPDNPLCPEIANLYKTDRTEYERIAQEWTKNYAQS